MARPFEKGNKAARGGARPGAGRKTDLFKKKCAELANSPHFFGWAKKVFKGEAVEPHVGQDGVTHTEASVSSRTNLWGKLADHGHGKSVSVLDMDTDDSVFIGVIRIPAKDKGGSGDRKRKA